MTIAKVYKIIGGKPAVGLPVRTQLDLHAAIQQGFRLQAAQHVKESLQLTEAELAQSLGVSAKTLQRIAREDEPHLTAAMSDRLYRIARIMAFAQEVFENTERAYTWLREPQRGLGNRTPFSLLESEAGAREVEDLLGRLEYGVYT